MFSAIELNKCGVRLFGVSVVGMLLCNSTTTTIANGPYGFSIQYNHILTIPDVFAISSVIFSLCVAYTATPPNLSMSLQVVRPYIPAKMAIGGAKQSDY